MPKKHQKIIMLLIFKLIRMPAQFIPVKDLSKWREYCFQLNMDNTTLHLAVPWPEVKELLKEVNSDLTDEDLDFEPGKEQLLLERLAHKMGRGTAHVKAWIESVSSNTRPAF